MQIVRPRLAFEREYGQHRNWWVRDPRLTGNPLSVLLYLMSHDQEHSITQTTARDDLGLGGAAWRAAKQKLMTAGFLVEIRDRYPEGSRRSDGTPCGGQNRYRLVLQDPEQGVQIDLEEAVIVHDAPYGTSTKTPGQSRTRKSNPADAAALENRTRPVKPPVRAALDNRTPGSAALDYRTPFIGREKDGMGLDGIREIIIPSVPSDPSPTSTREVDAELAAIHQSLSVDSIVRELRGRVEPGTLDLVLAARETLSASTTPGGVKFPPAYVARSITQQPERWLRGVKPFVPAPHQPSGSESEFRPVSEVGCKQGVHDWGPEVWGEMARAHCMACSTSRRALDPIFAALQDDFDGIGESQWVG